MPSSEKRTERTSPHEHRAVRSDTRQADFNPTALAFEMYAQRTAFGYLYKRADYQPTEALTAAWSHAAWVEADLEPAAPNITLAALRDVSRYMPGHDAREAVR